MKENEIKNIKFLVRLRSGNDKKNILKNNIETEIKQQNLANVKGTKRSSSTQKKLNSKNESINYSKVNYSGQLGNINLFGF